MDKKMFCFQCEQTAGCTGCTGNSGVCGKKADTAELQDKLTGALIGLARSIDDTAMVSENTWQIIIEGLFTTITNVSFDNAAIENMIQKVRAEKDALVPGCSQCQSPCGRTDDYDMQQLWDADEDIRSLKSLILFGIRGMAAYAYHAKVLNYEDPEVNHFFCEALFKIGYEESVEALLPTVLKVGEINLRCMALLDKANTETYGTPEPAVVTLAVEKGPFIVVTGHDLKDLQLLLEQTEGKGINIYTHGEMLPAHAYPFLKKFSHLKGNFGTAWQNQQKEFDHLPAPILYTTNCLMPPKKSYADRVFTTEMVSFPGAVHIDEKKDFTPIIEKALELGGYKEISFMITGDGAYSKLKYESGVHRVQRVPETETQGRVHTSTATVAVLPEAEDVEIEINPADLQIDTYRASGAGGQHVNKTESAIRITHLPTGLVVECQDERSQFKNKDKAMKILRSRLYEAEQEKQDAEFAAERRSQVGTGDRSERIRTYNYPQGRITDHRIGLTVYKFDDMLNGNLTEMIDALITADRAAKLQNAVDGQ